MITQLTCPRCGGTKFQELDCGPDTWDDDLVWTSYICENCSLYYSRWLRKWLVDCDSWREENDSEESIQTG